MDGITLYPVAGGWQASDPAIRMAAFGHTEAEAREHLAQTQQLSRDLEARIAAERARGQIPHGE